VNAPASTAETAAMYVGSIAMEEQIAQRFDGQLYRFYRKTVRCILCWRMKYGILFVLQASKEKQ